MILQSIIQKVLKRPLVKPPAFIVASFDIDEFPYKAFQFETISRNLKGERMRDIIKDIPDLHVQSFKRYLEVRRAYEEVFILASYYGHTISVGETITPNGRETLLIKSFDYSTHPKGVFIRVNLVEPDRV